MNFIRNLSKDNAENSIMQTIAIAVSAILIAAGLVTAPGLINNARDNNARTDLANIAYTEEFVLSSVGKYSEAVLPGVPSSIANFEDANGGKMKYSISGGVTEVAALVCDDPVDAYLLKAKSSSSKVWFRASGSGKSSTNLADLNIAQCIIDDPRYNDFDPDPAAITFDDELDVEIGYYPTAYSTGSFNWYKSSFNTGELETLDKLIAGFDSSYTADTITNDAPYQSRNWYNIPITTSTVYNNNGTPVGHVNWGDPESPTGFSLFANNSAVSSDTVLQFGSGYLSTFSNWENYYNFYNGGFAIIETSGGYKLKLNVIGSGLVQPSQVQNDAVGMYLGGAWDMGNKIYGDYNDAANAFTAKMFENDTYARMIRASDTVADFYYSPTGNENDFVLDAEQVNVNANSGSNAEFILTEPYVYKENINHYREDNGFGGYSGKGAWRVQVSYLGGVLTFNSDPNNPPYSWEPPTYEAPVITTTSLPSGFTQNLYNQTINVSGSPRATLALVSGTVPPGLNLSTGYWQEISGVPTDYGTYNFTVKAVNAIGESAPVDYTVVINGWTMGPSINPVNFPTINADGSRIYYKSAQGTLQTSYNAGQSYVASAVPASSTNFVSSRLGNKIQMTHENSSGAYIYTSNDYGQTFDSVMFQSYSVTTNHCIPVRHFTMSGNGVTLAGVTDAGSCINTGPQLWLTQDNGASWSKHTFNSAPGQHRLINNVTISDDGLKIAVLTDSNASTRIYRSSDGGLTWNYTALTRTGFSSLSMSGDGNTLITAGVSGGVARSWKSNDLGATWTVMPMYVGSPQMSTDGSTMVNTESSGSQLRVLTSKDGGDTWAHWYFDNPTGGAIAKISADGHYMITSLSTMTVFTWH